MKNILLALLASASFWVVVSCGQKIHSLSTSSLHAQRYTRQRVSIGSFNLLRLGKNTGKNLARVATIADDAGWDVFAGIEITDPQGALDLLAALKKKDRNWRVSLSQDPTGESSYKEYFAFFYKASVLAPFDSWESPCQQLFEQTLQEVHSCFAADTYEDGPDYERDPFIASFNIGHSVYTFVAVHLYYGDNSSKNIGKRQREASHLRTLLDQVRIQGHSDHVIALGDFNLFIDPTQSSAHIQESVFSPSPRLYPLVDEVTTIGKSSYDHFLIYKNTMQKVIAGSARAVSDLDERSAENLAEYKKEVSDHFPISMEISL